MAIAEQGKLNPFYYFGMMTVAMPGWALGTFLGTSVGNVLPANVVSALSVGLYGIVPALIIPASRKSKVILGVVVVSMAASFALECIPLFASLASGTLDHFAHCGDCRRGGAAVPGEGGGKGGGRPWSIMSISISPWWPW